MKKQTIWIILLIIIIIAFAIFIFTRNNNKKTTDNETNDATQEQENTTNDSKDKDTSNKTNNIEEDKDDKDDEDNNDYTEYTTTSMTIGEKTETTYTINSITNTQKTGYHEILFSITSSNKDTQPYITAKYESSAGVISVQLNQITKDNSGIAHQESEKINIKGISQIYRSVTTIEDEEVYEIGVSSSTKFKLESKQEDSGEWNVYLYIKYPGESTKTNIDLGSTEFSTEKQTITGATSGENASITGYSYSTNNGILKFIWEVSADGDTPIPSVESEYKDGKLTITFKSLTSDRTSSGKISLVNGLTLAPTRAGEETTYIVEGLEENTEYKLSASTSPNHINLEIKL